MDAERKEEDELLALDVPEATSATTGEGGTSLKVNTKEEDDEERLLLSSPSPTKESSRKGVEPDNEKSDVESVEESPTKDSDLLDDDNSNAEQDVEISISSSTKESPTKGLGQLDNDNDTAISLSSSTKESPSKGLEQLDNEQDTEISVSSSVKNLSSELEIIDDSDSEPEDKAVVSDSDDSELLSEGISSDRGVEDSVVTVEDSFLEVNDSSVMEVEDDDDEGTGIDEKIHIYYCNGALFVWNAEDVRMLREECRIMGKLCGCLPRAPRQNNHLGLPLQLLPEETKLLVDIDAAIVVEEMSVSAKTQRTRENAFKSVREENFEIQKQLYRENRKDEVRQRMSEIIAGKKAKKRKLMEESQKNLNENVTENVGELKLSEDEKTQKQETSTKEKTKIPKASEEVQNQQEGSENELVTEESKEKENKKEGEEHSNKTAKGMEEISSEKEKIVISSESEEKSSADKKKHVQEEGGEGEELEEEDKLTVDDLVTSSTSIKHSLVQIFTENPWKRSILPCVKWKFPETEQEAIRYGVFKDLWKKGYFLTSGSKFGGDFLVYPGDPCRFHSHFIAVCLDQNEEMSVLDLVSMGRLASNTRKTSILCSVNRYGQVTYSSLQWSGIS